MTADALFLFYFHDAGRFIMAERTGELVQQEALLRRELDLNCALITPGRTIDEIPMLVLSSAEELTGSPHGFVSVVDEKTSMVTPDITDQKHAEEGLRQANRKLKLLSGITRHDIQNQLTALLGYINLSLEMTVASNLQMIFRRENELVAQIRDHLHQRL